jgi:small conductance mechanosensitive channel
MTTDEFFRALLGWSSANLLPLLSAIAIVALGLVLARWAQRLILRLLPHASGIDRNFGPLVAQASRYGIIIFALVTALSFVGVPSASIYAVLGAGGLAIALALQNTLANIAAGLMLVWLRPIAIGEYVVADGVAGIVVEIGLFGTRLRSTSGLYIFTPNQKLWNSAITNHSREPRRRIDANISVPDSINVARARDAMLNIATADARVLKDPVPTVHVEAFSGDKIVLQLRAWVATPEYLPTLRDMTEKGKAAMARLLKVGGAQAEITLADDPHTLHQGERTPDLG